MKQPSRFGFYTTGLALLFFAGLLMMASWSMPNMGDPNSPAATHVAARYIEKAYQDTHTPNMVTAVLADYRGFDTLGETMVVFVAGVAAVLILRRRKSSDDS